MNVMITGARTGRTSDRAIQNTGAMYTLFQSSVYGDIRATIFDQKNNLLAKEDRTTIHLVQHYGLFAAVPHLL